MSKITLTEVGNLRNETSGLEAINDNFDAIVEAFDNTLSLDGTDPNEMQANLDMNNKRILNLPAPTTVTEPIRLVDIDGLDLTDIIDAPDDIGWKTFFGVSPGLGVQDELVVITPDTPPTLPDWPNPSSTGRIWIRSFDLIIYDVKNGGGSHVDQDGWLAVGSSYHVDDSDDPYLFCWIEPGSYHSRIDFPAGTGMLFPRTEDESPTPTITLYANMPVGIATFTWFLVINWVRAEEGDEA